MNKEKISLLAILANFVLAISKIFIGLISNSSSVFAQGLDSVTDIISSGITFIGIKISQKPADEKHPYGHHKFEVLSGLIISLILFFTGLWILYESYKGLLNPQLKTISYIALTVMAFSVIVNEVMARIKIYYGKKEQSISLISDGVHSRVDVVSSLIIFIGLLFTHISAYIDPILTLLIGLYIIKESLNLGKEALGSLLDVSAGKETEEKIKKIVKEEKTILEDLKTQKKGSIITANLIIKISKSLNIQEAEEISLRLQKKLVEKIKNLQYVTIQIESHDIENNYYKPKDIISKINFGKGISWKGKGRFVKNIPEAKGHGPGGKCVCSNCGYETNHIRGQPCVERKCPNCKKNMTRG